MIKVMLVDDHPIVQMGFRALLSGEADIEIVATEESGEAAYQRYKEIHPDVVVMDLSMPGIGGLETLRRIIAHDDKAKVLILSTHQDSAHCARALEFGALGYLCKRSAPEYLAQAIHSVVQKRIYLDPSLPKIFHVAGQDDSPAAVLSKREFEVFMMLARGTTTAEIAKVLHLSSGTVGTHLYNIKQKLNLQNQAEMTLSALRWGLMPQET